MGWGFEPDGSTTVTCAELLNTRTHYKDPFSKLIAASILWAGICHWLVIHSNRYSPHNTIFTSSCPTSQSLNFLFIFPVCTEKCLENFKIIACSGAITRLLSRSDKSRISVHCILLFNNWEMMALLNFNENEKVCPYRDPFPAASQQNTANHCSLLRDTPISRRGSG